MQLSNAAIDLVDNVDRDGGVKLEAKKRAGERRRSHTEQLPIVCMCCSRLQWPGLLSSVCAVRQSSLSTCTLSTVHHQEWRTSAKAADDWSKSEARSLKSRVIGSFLHTNKTYTKLVDLSSRHSFQVSTR